MSETPVGKLEA